MPSAMSAVRKHRAPKGALRRDGTGAFTHHVPSQKAPSAKRCIKTWSCRLWAWMWFRVRKHRAPKGALRPAIRGHRSRDGQRVRKHRAPKGALRQILVTPLLHLFCPVRKHRAPKGALRLLPPACPPVFSFASQKAPSAKRCIKTLSPIRMMVP